MSDPNKSQSQTRPNTKHRREHLLSEASSAPRERKAKERVEGEEGRKENPQETTTPLADLSKVRRKEY